MSSYVCLGATQTLIKQGVLTCRAKTSMTNQNQLASSSLVHRQVTVECPVRLDLSGGWTDTPPICYEHGGSVLNVAIMINNQRPIGARARLIESASTGFVTFILRGEKEKDDKSYELHSLAQFTDYNQPQRPCALLKTCCIFTGIIDINASQEMTLSEQLKKNFGGHSLVLEAWSNVPVGSGLGTSSILAGAILLALWNLIGVQDVSDSMIIRKLECLPWEACRDIPKFDSRWCTCRRTNDDNRGWMARSDWRSIARIQIGQI